jgi:hypothetical protein
VICLLDLVLGAATLCASCAQEPSPPAGREEAFVAIRGLLLGQDGAPAASRAVRLELGRQGFDLGTDRPLYLAAAHRATRTSEDGSFVFEKVPAGASVLLVSLGGRHDPDPPECTPGLALLRGKALALSRAAPVLRLKAGRKVTGRIAPPDSGIRLFAESGDGWLYSAGHFEREGDGRFVFDGLVPGDAWLIMNHDNEALPPRRILVPDGVDLELGPIGLPKPAPASRHSEVHAERARFVDPTGAPLPGLRLDFSTPGNGARCTSDAKGELLMKGGGLSIGEPPFRLYLHDIERASDGKRFQGVASERGDTVVITVTPKTSVRLTFRKADVQIADLVVVARLPEPAEGVVFKHQAGTFQAWLPQGPIRLIVGNVQGTVVEKELDVPAKEEHAATLDLP